MAQKHPVSIICGGPGRGKTYILKTLVMWLQSINASVALAAPTGKAANRIKNATGMEATTIHRLLQWQGHGQAFLHNEDNPLDLDWLIIDEFSMVDIFLFNSLLKALPTNIKLLIVGDQDQLPSVGPGMVLRDLLVSEVLRVTRLEKIYRQRHESPIIYAANDVNQGIVPQLQKFSQVSNWMDVSDCAMLTADDPVSTATMIAQLVQSMVAQQVDVNQSLMVLAPQKEGASGVKNLNKLLQPIFNPKQDNEPEVVSGEVIYREGDRVIQLKNRYDTVPAVMNGEIGSVVRIDPSKQLVTILFEGGASVDYNSSNLSEIMHSFCITCHKFQGSESQYVIFPILKSNYRMLTRQLVYTAMTRAQGTFIAVGQEEALALAVGRNIPQKRFTCLPYQLISSFDQLTATFSLIKSSPNSTTTTQKFITVAQRLRQRNINATNGQMTGIGTLALQMYETKYGHRPSKQVEQLGNFRFKTYHMDAIALVDSAIDLIIKSS